jgi:hypothetical protein
MKLQSRLLYRCLLIPALLIAFGCDDLGKDVVPPAEKVDQAADLNSTLAVNGPVLVNLVQSSNLTGNATISIVEQPTKGTLAILNSALLKYTPHQDFTSGNDHATYQVCVDGNCDTGRIDFNYESNGGQCQVTAVYDKASGLPTAAQIVVDVLRNDITCGGQFDVSTLKVVEAPAHGEAKPIDGLIFYYPEEDYQGAVGLVYSVALRSAPTVLYYGVLDITLQPAPAALTAVPDEFSYLYAEFADLSNSGTRMNFALNDILGNDELGALGYTDLTVTITRQPTRGTVTYYFNELFQWNPGTMFSGTDSFAYRICHNGDCSEAEVQITVAEPEPAPVAVPDDVVMTRASYDDAIQAGYIYFPYQNLVQNDNYNGIPTSEVVMSVSAQPETGGTVQLLGQDVFKFVPTGAFAGQMSFKYQLCYGDRCSEAVVTFTVTGW